MTLRRNILIFHLGALGDFVLTWPLALTLARLYPQSRIFYVTHRSKGALAEAVLRVESVDVEAGGWHHLFADPAGLPPASAALLRGAHTVVSFVADPGGRWRANVGRAAPEADVVELVTAPPEGFAGHVWDHLLAQLKSRPAADGAARQILRSVAARGLAPSRPAAASGPVVIHPGSGSPAKCWPAGRFLELARRLRGDGRAVSVLLGEAESERWGPEAAGRFSAVAEVHRPGEYRGLLEHLMRASAFVGNDSGPGHLAGVLGVPTVSIFGPATDPARWKPLGPRVEVVRGQPLESLGVEAVYDALGRVAGV